MNIFSRAVQSLVKPLFKFFFYFFIPLQAKQAGKQKILA
jgi:hypothetical protein